MENNSQAPVANEAAPQETPAESVKEEIQATEGSEEQEANQDASVESKDAKENKDSKEEKKKNIKKLKLKVDGEELEEELDLDNEEDLVNRLQLAKAAQKRMQQAATERKQIEAILQLIQKSPEKALTELGINAEEFAYNLLQQKVEEAKKSPEQLEKEKLQRELEELRAKYKEDEDNRKKQERERFDAEISKKIEEGMIRALDTAGIPKTPLTIKKMAEMLYIANENNVNLDASDVLPLVQREIEGDIKEFFKAAPDEMIEALLGSDRLNGMRKKQVEKIKKTKVVSPSDIKPTGLKAEEPKSDAKSKKVSIDEWLLGGSKLS